jgi:hypothetical protein
VGHDVIAVDPQTGATCQTRLVAMVKSTRECGTLGFRDRRLLVTSDHPIFDPMERRFAPAGDWLLGKRTHLAEVTATGLVAIRIDSVQVFSRIEDVFDLTVEHPWHTFVAETVLVHNKQPAGCTFPDGGGFVSYTGPTDGIEPCGCANGRQGLWRCASSGARATCESCGADAGP